MGDWEDMCDEFNLPFDSDTGDVVDFFTCYDNGNSSYCYNNHKASPEYRSMDINGKILEVFFDAEEWGHFNGGFYEPAIIDALNRESFLFKDLDAVKKYSLQYPGISFVKNPKGEGFIVREKDRSKIITDQAIKHNKQKIRQKKISIFKVNLLQYQKLKKRPPRSDRESAQEAKMDLWRCRNWGTGWFCELINYPNFHSYKDPERINYILLNLFLDNFSTHELQHLFKPMLDDVFDDIRTLSAYSHVLSSEDLEVYRKKTYANFEIVREEVEKRIQ